MSDEQQITTVKPERTAAHAAHFGTIGDKVKTYDGVPDRQIDELRSAGISHVNLRVQRRSAAGQLSTLPGLHLVDLQIMPDLEKWLFDQWGGGLFLIQVRDPGQATVCYFMMNVRVEGLPKFPGRVDPTLPAGAPGAVAGPPQFSSNMLAKMTPNELLAYQQSVATAAAAGLGAPLPQFSSDQVLQKITEEKEAELKKLREQQARENAERDAELKRLRMELERQQEAAREAKHAAQIEALRAEIRAATEATKHAAPPPPSLADQLAPLLGALAPFVPVFKEMITGSANKDAEVMKLLLSASLAPKPDTTKELLTTFLPTVMPLIKETLTKKDPSVTDQMALIQSMSDQQMNMLSMAAQLIEASAPPVDSPGVQVAKQVLDGVTRLAHAVAMKNGMGDGASQVLPSGPPPGLRGVPSTTGEVYDPNGGEEPPIETTPAMRRQRRAAAKPPAPETLALFKMLPTDFQTAEWQLILTALHQDPPEDVEEISAKLAGHIENLINLKVVPAELRSILVAPRETLSSLMVLLPVSQTHPDYAMRVLDRVLAMLREDGYTPEPAPQRTQAVVDATADDEDDAEGSTSDEEG